MKHIANQRYFSRRGEENHMSTGRKSGVKVTSCSLNAAPECLSLLQDRRQMSTQRHLCYGEMKQKINPAGNDMISLETLLFPLA